MNIAEMLEYCPKGTKLYSTAFGEVELINISPLTNVILVQNPHNTHFTFYSNGSYILGGECILFPSKDQRDWSKFRLPIKRGDIMMEIDGSCPFIASGAFKNGFPKYICGINRADQIIKNGSNGQWTSDFYIPASEEAKKKLFDKMAEAGYKWDANTLEIRLITQPKFKEGDVVIDDQGNLCLVSKIRNDDFITITAALYTNKILNVYTSNTVTRSIQLVSIASITDRNTLYSALVKEGYKYDKEQHLLIKQEFKPFDKVLARDTEDEPWKADIYLDYDEGSSFPYICTGDAHNICIPYEGNEYLLDTTDSPM